MNFSEAREPGGQGATETGSQGIRETGSQGNRETGRQGDKETADFFFELVLFRTSPGSTSRAEPNPKGDGLEEQFQRKKRKVRHKEDFESHFLTRTNGWEPELCRDGLPCLQKQLLTQANASLPPKFMLEFRQGTQITVISQ